MLGSNGIKFRAQSLFVYCNFQKGAEKYLRGWFSRFGQKQVFPESGQLFAEERKQGKGERHQRIGNDSKTELTG
jgi:hypothetical protein